MKPRVAHVFPTDRVAFLMRARLMRLQEEGFAISVVCGDRGYVEHLRECGLEVVPIPFAREIEPWTDLRCLLALRRELSSGRYQIAHSHNPKGTLLGPVAGRLARVEAVVHTVHGFLFNEITNQHFIYMNIKLIIKNYNMSEKYILKKKLHL